MLNLVVVTGVWLQASELHVVVLSVATTTAAAAEEATVKANELVTVAGQTQLHRADCACLAAAVRATA